MQAGTVSAIYRYPVKSLGGEQITTTPVGANGVAGDRGWVVRDESTGRFGSAKRIPALFTMSARYIFEPEEGVVPPAEITLPDGWKVRSDNPSAAGRVGEALGREVTLWPTHPAEDEDFYRTPANTSPDPRAEARVILGLEGDEPFPAGLSTLPGETRKFMAPLGTYFDAYPIHLVTTSALATISSAVSESSSDVRRFRPNFVVETGDAGGYPELEWAGKRIRVGGCVLEAVARTVRCSMVTLPQPRLERDTSLMRHLVRETGQDFGLYLRVLEPGPVAAGDRVEVE